MRIVQINTCNYGSTGKIMLQIAERANDDGHDCWIAIPKGRHNSKSSFGKTLWIGNRFSEDFHILMGRIFGMQGYFSILATLSFLKKLKKIKPDIIHLHNLHNSYINLPLLFKYIKKNDIKTIWTLHDCWAFTGHCPYFTITNCEKWKTKCYDCPSHKDYPISYIDHSQKMWNDKKKWFCGVKDMTIVTPSKWLANLVSTSFLANYDIKVVNNGIDIKTFNTKKGKFKCKYGLENKYVILGVAFDWGYRKGLDVFIELSKYIKESWQIVLVGVTKEIKATLPNNIIAIEKTQNQEELAEIYSDADVFLNFTREDNYPTVNMEAIACGTPVLTFDTGGSPEMILNSDCGVIIKDRCMKNILRVIESWSDSYHEDCSIYANAFDNKLMIDEYLNLYKENL